MWSSTFHILETFRQLKQDWILQSWLLSFLECGWFSEGKTGHDGVCMHCSMGDLTLGKRIWEFLLTTLMPNSNIATCWTWVLQDSNPAIQHWVPFLYMYWVQHLCLSIWCIADACSSNLKGGVCVFMLPFWYLSLDYMDHDPFLCRQIPVGLISICPYHSHQPCAWMSS